MPDPQDVKKEEQQQPAMETWGATKFNPDRYMGGSTLNDQLVQAGSNLINDAGEGYEDYEPKPEHYDAINWLHDNVVQPYQTFNRQQDINKYNEPQHLSARFNENISNAFNEGNRIEATTHDLDTLGHPNDDLPKEKLVPSEYLRWAGIHHKKHIDDNSVFYRSIIDMPTKELMGKYRDFVRNLDNPRLKLGASSVKPFGEARLMHDELARRGIDTAIFSPGYSDIYEGLANKELLKYEQHPIHRFQEHRPFHSGVAGPASDYAPTYADILGGEDEDIDLRGQPDREGEGEGEGEGGYEYPQGEEEDIAEDVFPRGTFDDLFENPDRPPEPAAREWTPAFNDLFDTGPDAIRLLSHAGRQPVAQREPEAAARDWTPDDERNVANPFEDLFDPEPVPAKPLSPAEIQAVAQRERAKAGLPPLPAKTEGGGRIPEPEAALGSQVIAPQVNPEPEAAVPEPEAAVPEPEPPKKAALSSSSSSGSLSSEGLSRSSGKASAMDMKLFKLNKDLQNFYDDVNSNKLEGDEYDVEIRGLQDRLEDLLLRGLSVEQLEAYDYMNDTFRDFIYKGNADMGTFPEEEAAPDTSESPAAEPEPAVPEPEAALGSQVIAPQANPEIDPIFNEVFDLFDNEPALPARTESEDESEPEAVPPEIAAFFQEPEAPEDEDSDTDLNEAPSLYKSRPLVETTDTEGEETFGIAPLEAEPEPPVAEPEPPVAEPEPPVAEPEPAAVPEAEPEPEPNLVPEPILNLDPDFKRLTADMKKARADFFAGKLSDNQVKKIQRQIDFLNTIPYSEAPLTQKQLDTIKMFDETFSQFVKSHGGVLPIPKPAAAAEPEPEALGSQVIAPQANPEPEPEDEPEDKELSALMPEFLRRSAAEAEQDERKYILKKFKKSFDKKKVLTIQDLNAYRRRQQMTPLEKFERANKLPPEEKIYENMIDSKMRSFLDIAQQSGRDPDELMKEYSRKQLYQRRLTELLDKPQKPLNIEMDFTRMPPRLSRETLFKGVTPSGLEETSGLIAPPPLQKDWEEPRHTKQFFDTLDAYYPPKRLEKYADPMYPSLSDFVKQGGDMRMVKEQPQYNSIDVQFRNIKKRSSLRESRHLTLPMPTVLAEKLFGTTFEKQKEYQLRKKMYNRRFFGQRLAKWVMDAHDAPEKNAIAQKILDHFRPGPLKEVSWNYRSFNPKQSPTAPSDAAFFSLDFRKKNKQTPEDVGQHYGMPLDEFKKVFGKPYFTNKTFERTEFPELMRYEDAQPIMLGFPRPYRELAPAPAPAPAPASAPNLSKLNVNMDRQLNRLKADLTKFYDDVASHKIPDYNSQVNKLRKRIDFLIAKDLTDEQGNTLGDLDDAFSSFVRGDDLFG